MLRIGIAGILAYVAAEWFISRSASPLIVLILRGSVTVGVYGVVLIATGFFVPRELRVLQDALKRASKGRRMPPPEPDADQVEMAGEIVATGRLAAEDESDIQLQQRSSLEPRRPR